MSKGFRPELRIVVSATATSGGRAGSVKTLADIEDHVVFGFAGYKFVLRYVRPRLKCIKMKLPVSSVWLPAYTPSNKLVVVLHGQGGSADDFRPLQDDLSIAEFNYLLLNGPEPY
jgi:hypothetical protein